MPDSMNNDKSDYGSMSREHYDLASAVNATAEFSGTIQDDMFEWVLDYACTSNFTN